MAANTGENVFRFTAVILVNSLVESRPLWNRDCSMCWHGYNRLHAAVVPVILTLLRVYGCRS